MLCNNREVNYTYFFILHQNPIVDGGEDAEGKDEICGSSKIACSCDLDSWNGYERKEVFSCAMPAWFSGLQNKERRDQMLLPEEYFFQPSPHPFRKA